MPSQIGLTRSVRRILATGTMVATGLGVLIGMGPLTAQSASAATAQTSVAPCTNTADMTPFSSWGDHADYFQVPNGDFANGSTNWVSAVAPPWSAVASPTEWCQETRTAS